MVERSVRNFEPRGIRMALESDNCRMMSVGCMARKSEMEGLLYWRVSQRRHSGGLGDRRPPPPKEKEKKKKRKKKKKKRKKRKKGTMNSVKLLHIKCCFSNFSIVRWHWKKKLAPQEKVEMTPLELVKEFCIAYIVWFASKVIWYEEYLVWLDFLVSVTARSSSRFLHEFWMNWSRLIEYSDVLAGSYITGAIISRCSMK